MGIGDVTDAFGKGVDIAREGLGDAKDAVGDGVNAGLGQAEELWHGAKKATGEGIEWGGGVAAEGLDRLGADGAADAVDDYTDKIASKLGADVAEQQLGDTEEAEELVHGNPGTIRASAGHLKDFAKAFDKVGGGMRSLDSSHWRGRAADTFREKFAVHPAKWLRAAEACEQAGEALSRYADTVKWAQGQARDAVDLYKKGKRASDTALDAYNTRVSAYNLALMLDDEDPGPRPGPFKDPGRADIERAHEILAEARRQRDEAGRVAAAVVRAALTHAPAEPSPLARLKANGVDAVKATNMELLHAGGGILKGGAGVVNAVRGVNPFDPYNLTHPAEHLQNVNTTLAGLLSTATHPDRAVKDAYESFKKDPSEFGGRLLPEVIGTKGSGLARGGIRAGAGRGLRDAAEPGGGRGAREALGDDHARHGRCDDAKVCKGTDPIDLATGTMYLPQTDVTLPGALPLVFRRRVQSGYTQGRWFGPSWTSTVDQRLEIDSEGVVLVTEDGLLLAYPHPAPGVPTLPSRGPRRPLDRVDGGYTLTDPGTRQTWHFADRGDGLAVLEQIDDRNGNWITFAYDADGAPRSLAHSGGYHVRLTTEAGRVTALHLTGAAPDGTDQELVRYGYTDGRLTEVVNSSGLPLHFTYDEADRVTSWTDTNGRGYTYAYDDQDRCVAEGGTDGHLALRLTYDTTDPATGHRVTTTTTGEGHTRRFLVNDAWQVVADIDPLGAVTRYERDRHDRLLSRTDPLGHTTAFRYDEAGNLLHLVRPDGREATAEYDEHGLPTRVVAPDGQVRRHTYDERGNRTSTTGPAGGTTHFTYDGAGRLTSVTDPLGNTTTVRCDAAGLPVETVDPLGAVTRYERDAFGRPVAVTDPLGATTRLEWTVEGHLARRVAPDGTTESWTYDGEGNCTAYVDALGAVSTYEYTHFDLLSARTGPDGVRYEFTHDTELRLTRVTNPQGLTWSYAYDAAGRLASETDFDDRTLTYAHDAAGRLRARTNALDQTVTFERNALGQVTRKEVDGRATTFAYDLTDQLAQATGPDGTTLTLLRDRFGRLRSETVDGRALTYTYDALGRRTGRTTPAGSVSTWTYDAAGRRTRLTTSGRTIDFAYDATGREVARDVAGFAAFTNAFDELGRLTGQTVTARDGHAVQHRAYSYRADGHLVGVDDLLNGARRFDLDPAGRVTAVHAANWTETYAYDEAGNQTTADWPATHPGHEATGPRAYTGTALTRAGAVRYEHDALGRVILRRKTRLSRKPDTWRYTWDAEDRLTSATTPDGTVWRYAYDPLGRRTAKLRMAPDGTTVTERTDFTWDGTTLCEQTTTAPAHLPNPVTLTWDHAGLRPIVQTERIAPRGAPEAGEEPGADTHTGPTWTHATTHPPSETSDSPAASGLQPASAASPASQPEIDSRFFAIVTDLVGTPSELVDERGEIAWRTRSTLWGTTAWTADSTTYTPLRFPGQYFDPETGLHYNYFRHYDPECGRYLTSDPLGLAPAPNPVTYVQNPHTWTDVLGLSPCKPWVVGKDDDPLVPDLVVEISSRYPGHMKAQGIEINGPDGKPLTDFDIVTDNAVIQVKDGSGKGALKQALTTQALTDYPVIVYLPKGRGSVIKSLEEAGFMVTRDKETLMQVVAP
ncbi:putative T7SS-secreted protein [Streptomyces longispororuber]|uniref:putative T7SS-secreted protein n=1 Tax=Streptomyces longispororuber TaxID=68230 RepID=UPI0033FBB3FE